MKLKSENQRNIQAVVLAGSYDFGRCSLTSLLPSSLWPVGEVSVLEHLLRELKRQGINRAVICSAADNTQLREAIEGRLDMQLDFLKETLPLGTAGCLRKAASDNDSLLLLIQANMVAPPDIDELVQEHCRAGSDLTVALHTVSDRRYLESEAAGIYLCEPSVLEFIPLDIYCDIKEKLIPDIIQKEKTVNTICLSQSVGSFRNRPGYLRAMSIYLENADRTDINLPSHSSHNDRNVWISPAAHVDKTARIYGPAIILDGASVAGDSIIFGPAAIGRNVNIGRNCLIAHSVLWDNVRVQDGCEIQHCLIDRDTKVADGGNFECRILPVVIEGKPKNTVSETTGLKNKTVHQLRTLTSKPQGTAEPDQFDRTQKTATGSLLWYPGIVAVLAAFFWSYWSTIGELWSVWNRSDEYSIGLLVPFLAVYIAWTRREEFSQCRLRPSLLWGMAALSAALGLRVFALDSLYGSAERLSLIVCLVGLILLLFGWSFFRKSITILLFLSLMLPLPKRFEAMITIPLQSWATSSAVFCLETFGYEIIREGNIIHLGDTTVAVAEACNGLRMITAFFVIIGLVALLAKRQWWEKFILVFSALPIALLCNTIRLAITSIAFTKLEGEFWEKAFHDFGGYAMMPLALAMVVLELLILTKLTTVPDENKKEEILITRSGG